MFAAHLRCLPTVTCYSARVDALKRIQLQHYAPQRYFDIVPMHCMSAPLQDMFIFRVEGTGVLRPDEVVSMALEWMQQKMLMLNTALLSNTGEDAMLE